MIAFEVEVPLRKRSSTTASPSPADGIDDVFELDDLIEKPSVDEAPSNLAVAARYVFSPAIFDYLEKTPRGKGNEIQLTDADRAC